VRSRVWLHPQTSRTILDGDHGLVGEGRDQFNLIVGKRPHSSAPQQNEHTNRIAFAQRYPEELCEGATQSLASKKALVGVQP